MTSFWVASFFRFIQGGCKFLEVDVCFFVVIAPKNVEKNYASLTLLEGLRTNMEASKKWL